MLDSDISTADALRLLSFADDDPRGFDRRRFLQMVGWGVGGGAMLGGLGAAIAPGLLPGRLREAWAASPIGPTDGIIVMLGMNGGNDGLNTVVPYANGLYYDQRANIALPSTQILPINSQIGLNSRLAYLKSLYDLGQVAIVQGVGYPNPDLSHFTSMALWMYGKAGTGAPLTGWVGRWLDGIGGADDLFRAATVGQSLPLSLVGSVKRGSAIPEWGVDFGADTDDHSLWMYKAAQDYAASSGGRGAWQDAIAATVKGLVDVGQEVAPVFARPLPDTDIEKRMIVAARLINADLGLRFIDTSYDGFDNHSGEPGDHADQMVQLDAALKSFFTTLDDRFRSRVTIMTYSEFGRTSFSNDSQGTDHGTANNHFVIGAGVKGGLYGAQPSLAGLQEWDRLDFNVDFRSIYATVLDGWMGGGSSTVLGGSFPNLGFFKQGPGQNVASGGVPTTVLGDYVPLTPYRLYDSRYGTGGRILPLGAGTIGEVQVLGLGGVPLTGVTAVAVNVTAVGATDATSFAVWPEGDPRPAVANVSSPAGRNVPNLVVVKVGAGGRINVGNDLGTTHGLVDVVGYFRTTAANRLQPITPFRALDTRYGTGGRSTPLGPATTYDVTVAGLANSGVPATAQAVVVNVTAVNPTARSWTTVWPAGATRPNASNLNFEIGQVIPNLVIAKVGTNGKISIYNNAGSTHYIVDILGYMSTTAPGRHFPLAPGRLLDTRPDNGGSGPLGVNGVKAITVVGVGGVPPSGVSAVALNVTAVGPTANTYLTVWPNGETRPTTSNLNPRAGQDVTNLVIVKVGALNKVQIYNQQGAVNLVVDVVGYFTS